jgi:hypothetical protein
MSRRAGLVLGFDRWGSVPWRDDAKASTGLDELERGVIKNHLSVVPHETKGDLLVLELGELLEEDCRLSGELKKLGVGIGLGNQSVWLAVQGEHQRNPRGRHGWYGTYEQLGKRLRTCV